MSITARRVLPDLQTSIDLIQEKVGTAPVFFAYPNGKTEEWARAFIRAGLILLEKGVDQLVIAALAVVKGEHHRPPGQGLPGRQLAGQDGGVPVAGQPFPRRWPCCCV